MGACGNCGRTIGRLERRSAWEGETVCWECGEKLAAQRPGTAPEAGRRPDEDDPLAALAAAGRPRSAMVSPRVQTVQLTAKKWKAMGCLGGVFVMAGCPLVVVGIVGEAKATSTTDGPWLGMLGLAAVLILIGFGIAGYANLMAWWHHG